jgi:hypothetical protein
MTAERAVFLAIQAAGQYDGEWESRVHQVVPVVAGMLRARSQAMEVAAQILHPDTKAIMGSYHGKQLEESSQRLIVSFVADNNVDGEIETLRTHRIDEQAGAAMANRLVALQPGDHCVFFKWVDDVNPKMKVRLLAGFERLPPRTARVSPPPQRPREDGPVRKAAPRAEVPNPNKAAVIRKLLEQLSTEDELKAKALLTKHGWEGVDDVDDDDWPKALYIARHAREDWF